MKLESLNSKTVEWLKGGPESDVVVSSRVRLARNIDGFPFVAHASEPQRARVEELMRNVLAAPDADPPLHYFRLDELNRLMLELMLERHLISHDHAVAKWCRAVAFDSTEQVSVMVNEEDHIRLQVIRGGLRLWKASEEAGRLDDTYGERLPFAYSENYGFLTACPTNVGTGMRVSVMLHLPAIVMRREMDEVLREVRERGLVLRGIYGEGSHGAGDFYQVSNQATLGISEQEIVESVLDGARELIDKERSVRSALVTKHPDQLRQRIQRAFELLSTAGNLSSEEALSFLSQVRLGALTDMLPVCPPQDLNGLFLLTLPAHLQTMEGGELDTDVRNEKRAKYLKKRLTTG